MSKVASAADGRRLLPRLPVSLPLDPSRVVNVPGCGRGGKYWEHRCWNQAE